LSYFGNQIVTFISAGENHAAVINMNGELWTWGSNLNGQCGVAKFNQKGAENIITFPVQPFQENSID
jgi:alpha-tubulin suppressor-like RCC1 family protein